MGFSILADAAETGRRIAQAVAENESLYAYITMFIRYALAILSVFIVVGAGISLFRGRSEDELWGYLSLPNGVKASITHWENTIGRSQRSDVMLNYPSVSRTHAALMRDNSGNWTVTDLNSKTGTFVNGKKITETTPIGSGGLITVGGVEAVLMPLAPEEKAQNLRMRGKMRFLVHPALMLVWLTQMQILLCIQLTISLGERLVWGLPAGFFGLTIIQWVWYFVFRCMKRRGFEVDIIGFFLATLGMAITATSAPSSLTKQFGAILLGLLIFIILGWILSDLDRVKKLRWLAGAGVLGLLAVTLIFGETKYGAKNWINIGGMSLQLSELAKVCFVFSGAATLERLFARRNLVMFIALSGACVCALALQGDYGTALIFFVTFLVIAFLRSGDLATVALIAAAAVFGAFLVIQAKPHIASRFSAWRHVWDFYNESGGYQQTRTMACAASGGMFGLGAGNGWLHNVGAANTDLVFGVLCEELGLIVALCAIAAVIILTMFTVRCAAKGRSSYYVIAACAAASMMVLQVILNVLGSVDILPLTGVTFPFVSTGGSSLVASWGLLAFIKSNDTRPRASFIVRMENAEKTNRGETEQEAQA